MFWFLERIGPTSTLFSVRRRSSTSKSSENSESANEDHAIASTSTISICGQTETTSILSGTRTKGSTSQRSLKIRKGQSHRQTSILSHVVRPISLPRQQKINDLIINMIIKDLQPLSIVEDRGFRELIGGLEPSYVIPSRFTFTNSFLPQKYQQKKEKLKNLISKADSVALTTDGWTAQHSQMSYICYTAHFITPEWNLHSCLLECGQYDESHTAQHLQLELFRIGEEWGISEKVFSVTTDNAANVKAGVRLTGWGHIGCFAHTLNLVVQSGLEISDIKPLRKKVKGIVEHFHRSTKANNKFLEIQKQMSNESSTPLKLKNDIVTRWNSTYFMFERFLKVREPLVATLGILNNPVQCLSEEEWQLLKDICLILKPFEQLTIEMSAEKNVTLSKVIIIVKGLKSAIVKFKQTITNPAASALIIHYEKEISERFLAVETNNLMAKCSMLDPRFKSKVFSSDQTFNLAKERLESDVARMISVERRHNPNTNTNDDNSADSESLMDQEEEENLIWADFDKICKSRKEIDPKAAAILEVRSYLAEDLISRKENPLEWWKARAAIYPHLAKLAKQYLCIVATSVPSERIFSKAGQLISERRSRLKGKNVQIILFLNYNQDL